MKQKKFYHAVPFMPVRNLQETINFYKEKLGFYNEWFWKDTDAGMQRDNFPVLFTLSPAFVLDVNKRAHSFEIMWFVDNVDAIYEEYKGKELSIFKDLIEEPWGVKEFGIEDVNGYRIRIAEHIVGNEGHSVMEL